jgi:hypothetical protein
MTKTQSSTLSTLRQILRHVRREWDARVQQATPTTREFAGHIMSQYRTGAVVKDRVKVRQMKATASAFLEYLRASEEQKVNIMYPWLIYRPFGLATLLSYLSLPPFFFSHTVPSGFAAWHGP